MKVHEFVFGYVAASVILMFLGMIVWKLQPDWRPMLLAFWAIPGLPPPP